MGAGSSKLPPLCLRLYSPPDPLGLC